jgi:hypothetical protein
VTLKVPTDLFNEAFYKTLAHPSCTDDAWQIIDCILTTDEVTLCVRTNTRGEPRATGFVNCLGAEDAAARVNWNRYPGGLSATGEVPTPAMALWHEFAHGFDWVKHGHTNLLIIILT